MYENFTDGASKVMQLANQEAQRFNHEYIGTEHILLGLVRGDYGRGLIVIESLGIDPRKIRLEVEKLIQSGPDMVTKGKLPQTPWAKRVIEYAMTESRNLNHDHVGTEHILLGLLCEVSSVTAQVFMNLGLTLEKVRVEVRRLPQRYKPTIHLTRRELEKMPQHKRLRRLANAASEGFDDDIVKMTAIECEQFIFMALQLQVKQIEQLKAENEQLGDEIVAEQSGHGSALGEISRVRHTKDAEVKKLQAEIDRLRSRMDYRWPDDLGWDGVSDCVALLKSRGAEIKRLQEWQEKVRADLFRLVGKSPDDPTGHELDATGILGKRLRDKDNEIEQLREELRTIESFKPTPEQTNALPKGIREYVYQLETRCDPAGDVAELMLTKDRDRMIVAEIKRLQGEVHGLQRENDVMMARLRTFGSFLPRELERDREAADAAKGGE